MITIKIIRFLVISITLCFSFVNGISLTEHDRVVISTDLEPDDVLALAIIFQEANHHYVHSEELKYPIDMVIVGEGNTAIKRMRMEKMLRDFLSVPTGVKIKVIEGKSTHDNVFSYDGEELFPPEAFAHTPYIDQSGEDATAMLADIIRSARAPLIVQLKPAQELLSLDADLMRKTSVLFYGSFNFRKTASEHLPLQSLLDYFSEHFARVGVVESYGMLGDQSTVYPGHTWTHAISRYVEESDQPFLSMFRELVTNWNRYLLEDHLPDVQKAIVSLSELTRIDFEWELSTVDSLIACWNLDLFLELKHRLLKAVTVLQASNPTDALTRAIERIQWVTKFTDLIKPESGLQFTLADVGLALALVDHTGVFTSRPVRFIVSSQGFLTAVDSSESSVFYYDRVEKEAFSKALLDRLQRLEMDGLDPLDNLDILDDGHMSEVRL